MAISKQKLSFLVNFARRGMREAEMETIADFLDRSMKGEVFTAEVEVFNDKYRQAHYSFDKMSE